MYKLKIARGKRAKLLFFIVKYANLRRSYSRRRCRRDCLSFLKPKSFRILSHIELSSHRRVLGRFILKTNIMFHRCTTLKNADWSLACERLVSFCTNFSSRLLLFLGTAFEIKQLGVK